MERTRLRFWMNAGSMLNTCELNENFFIFSSERVSNLLEPNPLIKT
jgi:hypothetical protein